jgi:hypothetical protein
MRAASVERRQPPPASQLSRDRHEFAAPCISSTYLPVRRHREQQKSWLMPALVPLVTRYSSRYASHA